MQYGSTIQLPSIDMDEVVEISRKKKQKEPYPGFTIFGNGKETRYGGKSMDILDVCKKLNTAEMNLLQIMRDAIERSKVHKEKNVNMVTPAKLDEWTPYLATALKKNYSHMNCLGIIRRARRGTYMINPLLFIPPSNVEYHKQEWESLEETCSE